MEFDLPCLMWPSSKREAVRSSTHRRSQLSLFIFRECVALKSLFVKNSISILPFHIPIRAFIACLRRDIQ